MLTLFELADDTKCSVKPDANCSDLPTGVFWMDLFFQMSLEKWHRVNSESAWNLRRLHQQPGYRRGSTEFTLVKISFCKVTQ